ncbi:hypothetical protein J2749_000546 [Methanobacterium oryzae]
MIETYKIVIAVLAIGLIFYALINDPLKKNE